MKHSLLVSFISTLALSFRLVGAISTRGLQTVPQVPIYDVMGIASNQIVCRKSVIHLSDTAYNKREAYAAVAQAMWYRKEGKTAVVGCESLKICRKYPRTFNDDTIKFKTHGPLGPLYAFPLRANGQILKGGRISVSDLVIFQGDGVVVGIVYASFNRYIKCLIDDNFKRGPQTIGDKLKYQFQYHTGKTTSQTPNGF